MQLCISGIVNANLQTMPGVLTKVLGGKPVYLPISEAWFIKMMFEKFDNCV